MLFDPDTMAQYGLTFAPWDAGSLWRAASWHAPLLELLADYGVIQPVPDDVRAYWQALGAPHIPPVEEWRRQAAALLPLLEAEERFVLLELPSLVDRFHLVGAHLATPDGQDRLVSLARMFLGLPDLQWEDLPGSVEAARERLALRIGDLTGRDLYGPLVEGYAEIGHWWPQPTRPIHNLSI